MHARRTRGFTIIELLVVVSIIALLVGILLPAITKARDQSKVTASFANLRNIGTAHKIYAAEFADRQWSLVHDSIASYGNGIQVEKDAGKSPFLEFFDDVGLFGLYLHRALLDARG